VSRLSESALKQLIKGGETSTVEFKLAAPRAVDLAERLCGMANAKGGVVIVGVEDSTGEIVGVADDRIGETLDVILRAARQVIKPTLLLDPPEPEVVEIAEKKLVIATVKPSDGPIYQAGGIFWMRRGTQTSALNALELSEMMYDRGLRNWELEPAYNAALDDIDEEKVQAYLKRRLAGGGHAGRFKNLEQVLIGMRCAVRTTDEKVVPTNAGILFFGRNPQWHIIQAEIVCVLFRETVGASRYADRKIVTGTLQELIDGAEAFLNRYIAVGARVEGFKRIDIPEYSIEVLREAVINAVVHRDYSRSGESIRVFYYPDRVEVHSPGLLLPGITIEQMERGIVQSKLRNPVLASLLRDIPGYMERIGSGVRFMLDETKRLKLPAPHFQETGEFVVTFAQAPDLARKPYSQPQPQYSGTLWSYHKQPPVEEPVQVLPAEQESRLIDAVAYVREHGFITNKLFRELTGVSDRTAHRDLETLVERGRLKAVGQRAARRYVLA
jgi:ATP-dependent DNA helicase RecG